MFVFEFLVLFSVNETKQQQQQRFNINSNEKSSEQPKNTFHLAQMMYSVQYLFFLAHTAHYMQKQYQQYMATMPKERGKEKENEKEKKALHFRVVLYLQFSFISIQ